MPEIPEALAATVTALTDNYDALTILDDESIVVEWGANAVLLRLAADGLVCVDRVVTALPAGSVELENAVRAELQAYPYGPERTK